MVVSEQGYDKSIPPAPSNRRAADAIQAAINHMPDRGILGDIYKPDRCAAALLETMYWQFRAEPLYWAFNPESVTRRIYANFYVPGDGAGGNPDGILPNKNAIRGLDLFSESIGLAYRLSYRRSATGKKLGVTLYVQALNRDFYDSAPGGQSYLTAAYRFLLPARLPVDGIVFEDNSPFNIYARFDARPVVITGL